MGRYLCIYYSGMPCGYEYLGMQVFVNIGFPLCKDLLGMYVSIYISIHPSNCPSTNLSIHPSIHPSIHLSSIINLCICYMYKYRYIYTYEIQYVYVEIYSLYIYIIYVAILIYNSTTKTDQKENVWVSREMSAAEQSTRAATCKNKDLCSTC